LGRARLTAILANELSLGLGNRGENMSIARIEKKLFEPNAIVVYGASEDPGKLSGRTLSHLRKYGYRGKIYPVNPKYDQLSGLKTYKRVEDIPEERLDFALILVPAQLVPEALIQCGKKGVAYCFMVASGFGEVGDKDLAQRIIDIAREYRMRLIGPNCVGIVQPGNGVVPTFSTVLLKEQKILPGSISMATQSGALGNGLLQTFRDRQIGLRSWISTGNEADLGLLDFVDYLLDDEGTGVIGCFVEGLKEGERLIELGRRSLNQGKPLVMLMAGRSAAGREASSSHTGKIIGSDPRLTECLLRQTGILQVESVEEFLDALVVLSRCKNYPQGGVGVLTVSGGMGVLLADACDRLGLKVASLTEETKQRLISSLPANIVPKNPIDTVLLDNAGYIQCAAIALEDKNVSHLILIASSIAHNLETLGTDLTQIAETAKRLGKTVSVCFLSPSDSLLPSVRKQLEEEGSFVYEGNPIRALKSIHLLETFGRLRAARAESTAAVRLPVRPRTPAKNGPEKRMDALIQEYGLPAPKSCLAQTRDQAVAAARQIGYPVVIKLLSPDILHKTEAGMVKLDVKNDEEAARVCDQMLATVAEEFPAARVLGISVEEMVKGGVECIFGIVPSGEFGPVAMFGAGGIMTELTRDVSYRAFPLDRNQIRGMIEETRVYQLLKGFRGSAPKDIDSLIEAIARTIQLYDQETSISELEINPFIVLDKGKGTRLVDLLFTTNK
jgi:acetate---CoA ligase (ADP-forming)